MHRRYSIAKMKLPRRIILVRHGQSLGNVDELAYCTIPDWKIPLTETGKRQATEVGRRISRIIGPTGQFQSTRPLVSSPLAPFSFS